MVPPMISLGVATAYRRSPRVSTANPTMVVTARAAVLSVANCVARNTATHVSPRQLPRHFPRNLPWQFSRLSAAIATATRQLPRNSAGKRKSAATGMGESADAKPRHFPRPFAAARQSAAMATSIFRQAAIATQVRGRPRQFTTEGFLDVQSQQFPRLSSAVGHCHGNHLISGNRHATTRKSAAFTTAVSVDVKSQQFQRPSAAAIATAIATLIHGNFPFNRGSCNGNPRYLPRQAMGCHVDHGDARQAEGLSMPYRKKNNKRSEKPQNHGRLGMRSKNAVRNRNCTLPSWSLYQ